MGGSFSERPFLFARGRFSGRSFFMRWIMRAPPRYERILSPAHAPSPFRRAKEPASQARKEQSRGASPGSPFRSRVTLAHRHGQRAPKVSHGPEHGNEHVD